MQNILLVGNNDLFSHHLTEAYVCDYANSEKEALESLSQKKFSIILSDFKNTKFDGKSFLSAIRAKNDHTPVVFLMESKDVSTFESLGDCCGRFFLKSGKRDDFFKVIEETSSRSHELECK